MSFGIPVRNGLAIGLLASTALSSRSGRNSVASLILNFTDGIYRALGMNYSFSSLITFTRSTTATFVGTNGLIQTAAIDAPRFDYNPSTLAANGLLIEEQRVNLMTYASDYANVAWTKTDTTVTSSAGTAPDGTNSATLLTQGTVGTAEVSQTFNITAGNTITYSRYVKIGNARWYRMQIRNAGLTSFANAWFDLTNGVVGSTSTTGGFATLFGSTITNAGNGWFRLTFTVMIGAAFSTPIFAGSSVSADGSAAPVNSATRYEWGNQAEAGAFATSYIPTVASTVTRAADIVTMTGTNFSSWYNQSAGTIVVQATAYGNKASSILTRIQDAAATTNFITARQSATGTQILGQTSSSGGLTAGLASTNFTIGVPFKIAVASAPSDVAASVNGGTVGTSTAMTTMPVVDRLNISEGGPFYVRTITYYPSRLTNAQLQALTA